MSKIVRRVSLASLALLLCAAGSCYVGERQYWNESEQLEKWMEASGFYISHVYPDTNIWQIIGVLLFFVSVSIALAAFVLWRQERKEKV
jgi:hypothetical protein